MNMMLAVSASIQRNRHMMGIPKFDLHNVEQALRINHRIYEGKPLSETEIAQGIKEYREFLFRHKQAGAPEQFEQPGHLVDRVWHTHMCETKQYEDDCISYFGKKIHHSSKLCEGGAESGDW